MSLSLAFGKNAKEDHDFEDLLLEHRSNNFKGEAFWSFDTLCQILTRDRLQEALSNLFPKSEVDTHIDLIAPVHATAQDALNKSPVQPSSHPKRFMKVFAILVLLQVPERIKDFIESDVSDNDLPLCMDRDELNPRPNIHKGNIQSLACFHQWNHRKLDMFYETQWGFKRGIWLDTN
ncbi:hypothetical protein IL306_012697 [Fusarium sp. DS 682]|nr:hypothetical protein IL306_012697 [Fusarium sp. DS 682]